MIYFCDYIFWKKIDLVKVKKFMSECKIKPI